MSKRLRWEYEYLLVADFVALNEAGVKGWELVSANREDGGTRTIFWLKRKIVGKALPPNFPRMA